MAIHGLGNTRNTRILERGDRPESWQEMLNWRYPNEYGGSLYVITSALKKGNQLTDPRDHWFEQEWFLPRFALTANLSAGDVTLTVDKDATFLKAGDLLQIEQTGEQVRVTTDPTQTTEIAISRSFGTVAATAVVFAAAGTNPNIRIVGSAYPENSLAPSERGYTAVERNNQTQIFRTAYGVSRTARKTQFRTGPKEKELREKALIRHMQDIENTMWWGQMTTTLIDGNPRRTMDGIDAAILADHTIVAPNDGIDMDWVEERLKEIFVWGSSEKMAFMGNTALLAIQQSVRKNSNYEIFQNEKEFGMNVSRLVSPFGELILKKHPFFNLYAGGTTGGTQYYGLDATCFVLDMDDIEYCYIDNTMHEAGIETPGQDGVKNAFLTECMVKTMHRRHHWKFTNMRAGVADS